MKKLLIAICILIPMMGVAQIPEKFSNSYVHDYAGVLDVGEIQALNESIFQIEKNSSVQIALVLVNKIPENMEIEDFTLGIGRQWHVGNAKNGLVYVAAIEQRKQRLEVASALQGDIPDITAHRITDMVKPYFRSKDYAGGLGKLLKGIKEQIDPVAKEQKRLGEIELAKKREKDSAFAFKILWWLLGSIAVGCGVLFGIVLPRQRKRDAERAEQEELERRQRVKDIMEMARRNPRDPETHPKPTSKTRASSPPVPPPIIIPPTKSDDDDDSRSSSYRSRNNGDDMDSNYGNYGSGSSGSDSSSGFTGGGSNNDW